MVFVNDEVIEDGVVMGSIKVAAGVGVQADGDVVSAARQAVAASGSPAAALVMGSSSAVFASAQEETTSAPAAPTDQQQLAVVIGRTTPVIGLVGAAVLGAKGGSLHSGAVLVCCMGKEIYP
jgi:hypothetical protein